MLLANSDCPWVYTLLLFFFLLQDDDDSGRDYFGSLADGINHTITIHKVNRDLYHQNCYIGILRSITFSLVQAIAGDEVSFW